MTSPPCDKHPNLQMVPFPFESTLGKSLVYVCPVPSCGRQHDDQGYFEVVEGELVRGQNTAPNTMAAARDKVPMTMRAEAGA